jgi:hypothetical protein
MANQPPLFDDVAPAPRPISRSLTFRGTPKAPLTKTQKAFNRLVAKVEHLRTRLEADRRRFEEALVYHHQHVRHRIQTAVSVRSDLIRVLAPFLDDRRLNHKDTDVLRVVLMDQLDDVLTHAETVDDDLSALFERLHGANLQDVQQEELNDARAGMEAVFADMGLDVDLSGFGPGMSEHELAAQAAELAEELKRQALEAEARTRNKTRKTKREVREEERARRCEDARKVSLGSIYRQLVKVLHPDLEQDAGRRECKGQLMQEVTAAYAAQDLHTLLRLQLEWIQREEGDLARLTDERLDAFNLVLKEQVAQLELELAELPLHPKFQPLAQDFGPFGSGLRTNGPAEAARLDSLIVGLRSAVESLQPPNTLKNVRVLIREQRAAQKAMARRRVVFPY